MGVRSVSCTNCPLYINGQDNFKHQLRNVRAIRQVQLTCKDTSYTNTTECQSYEWNGQTYTESGTYEYSGFKK